MDWIDLLDKHVRPSFCAFSRFAASAVSKTTCGIFGCTLPLTGGRVTDRCELYHDVALRIPGPNENATQVRQKMRLRPLSLRSFGVSSASRTTAVSLRLVSENFVYSV